MEILGGGSGIDDLQIIVRSEMQKALEPGAGVLGSRAFKAVRQKQDQSAKPLPFIFGAGDELVHDRLGGIPEIAVLRFPRDEAVGKVQTVTVFETEHARFR